MSKQTIEHTPFGDLIVDTKTNVPAEISTKAPAKAKKVKTKVVSQIENSHSPLTMIINTCLDTDEQLYYRLREKTCRQDFEINSSTDEMAVHQMLMCEINLNRLFGMQKDIMSDVAKGERDMADSIDIAKQISQCQQRLFDAMKNLNMTRKQTVIVQQGTGIPSRGGSQKVNIGFFSKEQQTPVVVTVEDENRKRALIESNRSRFDVLDATDTYAGDVDEILDKIENM